jgi:hypothetical protein
LEEIAGDIVAAFVVHFEKQLSGVVLEFVKLKRRA